MTVINATNMERWNNKEMETLLVVKHTSYSRVYVWVRGVQTGFVTSWVHVKRHDASLSQLIDQPLSPFHSQLLCSRLPTRTVAVRRKMPHARRVGPGLLDNDIATTTEKAHTSQRHPRQHQEERTRKLRKAFLMSNRHILLYEYVRVSDGPHLEGPLPPPADTRRRLHVEH